MERGFLGSRARGGGRKKDSKQDTNPASSSSKHNVDNVIVGEECTCIIGSNEGNNNHRKRIKADAGTDTTGVGSCPPLPTYETTTGGNAPGNPSYANANAICKPSGKKLNIRILFTPGGNGIDVVVLAESIRAISERFANTAYGFLLGNKVAYPVIANYVRNTWGKYRLIRSMFISSTRLFSFQFSSMDGLDAMLENVWVKLHGVPVMAFSEDGLSDIATKLGNPLMLDSYTSDMYMQSWGRSSYARVMIEL
ncbi:high affinity nitrate transporter 2.4-like protein [Tanacetum coccineum]